MAEFRRATDELKDEFRQIERDVDTTPTAASYDEPPSASPTVPSDDPPVDKPADVSAQQPSPSTEKT
jgi:hypothetical protein